MGVEPTGTGLQPVAGPSGSSVVITRESTEPIPARSRTWTSTSAESRAPLTPRGQDQKRAFGDQPRSQTGRSSPETSHQRKAARRRRDAGPRATIEGRRSSVRCDERRENSRNCAVPETPMLRAFSMSTHSSHTSIQDPTGLINLANRRGRSRSLPLRGEDAGPVRDVRAPMRLFASHRTDANRDCRECLQDEPS